jgi:NAD(P)-dependent dehydrogenase (short-subunit alcohol dehydrogenase family)
MSIETFGKTSLDGKVAIVTGASSGIGRASAILLAERGAKVVVGDITVEGGEETAQIIGENAIFVRVDVSDEASVQALVDKTLNTFGRLDIAHNNAGIVLGGKAIPDTKLADFERVISVNLTGVFLAMRAQIPAMLKTGGGSIINTSSVAGVVAQVGNIGYISSKHGVIGLTKAAAVEFSDQGIRVNAVLPGTINTPMVQKIIADNPGWVENLTAAQPIQRLGEPEEIAEAVAWLASDAASAVTGTSIAVDGGFIAQ